MSKDKIAICKVSKGKNQLRVTLPKAFKSDYVAVKQLDVNVFDSKRKYYR